ncbi:MAG: (2Fe-2S)-binding protein [Deltaproteobacteria bacterium]|nr:(2Fe-2S)-binding protein [Deltaproteobacteria bacterium]
MDKKTKQEDPQEIEIIVNNIPYSLTIGIHPDQVGPSDTLAKTLRETLGLTGTKVGCDQGSCGACTVIMDGLPILSCLTLTIECDGRHITTIEGLQEPKTGKLDPLQQSFIDHTAFQCGFCTPGMIMASRALLDNNPSPKTHEVKEALSGHFCRCISHYHVLDAVLSASKKGG